MTVPDGLDYAPGSDLDGSVLAVVPQLMKEQEDAAAGLKVWLFGPNEVLSPGAEPPDGSLVSGGHGAHLGDGEVAGAGLLLGQRRALRLGTQLKHDVVEGAPVVVDQFGGLETESGGDRVVAKPVPNVNPVDSVGALLPDAAVDEEADLAL